MAAGGLGRLALLAGVLVLAATFVPSLLGYGLEVTGFVTDGAEPASAARHARR